MIKHIVMWKLKETELKTNTPEELKEKLLGLKEKISVIKSIEVGINIVDANRFDIVLIVDFDRIEDLSIYQNHPEHLLVVDFIKKVITERVAIDYEY